jgi:hypothetical protein
VLLAAAADLPARARPTSIAHPLLLLQLATTNLFLCTRCLGQNAYVGKLKNPPSIFLGVVATVLAKLVPALRQLIALICAFRQLKKSWVQEEVLRTSTVHRVWKIKQTLQDTLTSFPCVTVKRVLAVSGLVIIIFQVS